MAAVRLWVDDERVPPSTDWVWVRTPARAVRVLLERKVSELSLDHDLGGEVTTRPILHWLCAHPDRWPTLVRVHTADASGRAYLLRFIYTYSPYQGRGGA